MGVKILSNTYRQIDSPNTPTTWPIGNIGTWQRLTVRFEVAPYIEFSQSNSLFMEEPNRFTLTDGTDWQQQGFEVGDTFVMVWQVYDQGTGSTSTYSVFGQITSIQGAVMLSSNATLGVGAQQSNIYPTQLADQKIFNAFITANKENQSIDFTYGHLLNSQHQTAPLNSLIDGTKASFVAEDVDGMSVGDTLAFTPIAPQSGMSIANVYLSYKSFTNVNPLASGFIKRIYEIDVFFMLSLFFDDTSSFNTLDAPIGFRATECLADNYEITVSPLQNNPNLTISSNPKLTAKQGNTGWFNENYNGLEDVFQIESLEYKTVTLQARNSLDFEQNTLFRAVISGVKNLSGQTKCTFGFQWIPNEQGEYKNLPTPYYENSKTNTGGLIGAFLDVFTVSNIVNTALRQGYSSDGASMDVKNIRFQQTGVDEITFECEFQPNSDFGAFMNALDISERNYIIWIGLGDSLEPTNTTDRVSKLLDYNQMDTFFEPVGAYNGMTIDLLNHEQNENSTASPCGSPILIEDGLLSRFEFNIDTTQSLPTGLQYVIALQRDADDFLYLLESTPVDLSIYPNVQSYSFSDTKGYKLSASNNKNFVKVEYYPALDNGTSLGVRGLYGFKVRWEDWISRGVVPVDVRNEFFNNTLRADGISNDWYRYLNTAGWSLQLCILIDTVIGGRPVRYINKRELAFRDYDQNANIATQIEYFRESTGAPLSGGIDPQTNLPLGVILEDERTRVEITYTRLNGSWSSLVGVYALTTIEVRDGIGAPEYRELSSLVAPESDTPLETDTGLLELTLISPTQIKATCYVNPDKLASGVEYKVTGRIK